MNGETIMTKTTRTALIGTSLLALVTTTTAQAQDAKPADVASAEPGDIIVTAQFRNQKLQDTPLAITAVNAALLEARGQVSVTEVAAQAPNVTLAPQGQQNGSGLIAFIRGVGQTDFNFALEPGVGMYVDEVYIPTLTGSLLDLMDLDRVEVLRGPQGTLAGRNSIGGAIKLFSVKPKGDGSGSMSLTYGAYNRVDVRGMADFALVEGKLAARITGVAKTRKGHVTRLDYGLTHPGSGVPSNTTGGDVDVGRLGGVSYVAGRVALKWTPSETIEVNIAGDYSRERSDAGASVLLYGNNAATNANGQPWLPNTINGGVIPLNCRFVPNGVNSCDTLTGYDKRYISYSTFLDRTPATTQAPFKPLALDPHMDLDNYGVSAIVDIELSDNFSLKSISAWRGYVSDWSQDVDNTPLANQQLTQRLKNRQWSEELRLNGALMNDRLEFTLGGIYFKRDGTLTARVDLNYAGLDFIHGPDPTPASSKALFGNFTFHATDALNITAGLRNTWDKKDYVFFRRNPDLTVPGPGPCAFFTGAPTAGPTGIGNAPNCLLLGLNNVPDGFKGNKFDWRVAADYRFSPEAMVYAQVATGYRSGGVNPRPFFGPSAGARNQIKSFNPETLIAYEMGFKTDLLDRRVRLNVSAFYNDYKDIILTLSACPTAPCLQPNNVGSAKVKGIEVETTLRPVDGLTIDGAFSYLDFQYKSFSAPQTLLGGITLDMITPYTPTTKYSFGVQYDIQEVAKGTLSARFDGSYQAKLYTEALNYDAVTVATRAGGPLPTLIASNRINGYFLGNARLTWKNAEDNLSVSAEVQNLFDKYYFTSLYEQYASPGTISGAPGLPRTWSVSVKRLF
jgi:iron complex outermembrane recepter protein